MFIFLGITFCLLFMVFIIFFGLWLEEGGTHPIQKWYTKKMLASMGVHNP
jgi:hypothetical protein